MTGLRMKPCLRSTAKPRGSNANTMQRTVFAMMSSLATLSPAALLWIGGVLGFVAGFFVAGIVVSLRGQSANADLRAGQPQPPRSVYVPPRRQH